MQVVPAISLSVTTSRYVLRKRVAVACAYVHLQAIVWAAAPTLKVQVFDVGQGDAVLVTCPDGDHQILIDSGCNKYPRSQENFRRELAAAVAHDAAGIIEVAVASHPHSDHIGGMAWVLNTFSVGTFIDNGRPHDTDTWRRLQSAVRERLGDGILRYMNGWENSLARVPFCAPVVVTLIAPAADADLSHPNDQSVLVRIDYGSRSFLLVGDLEEEGEHAWLDELSESARALIDVDVLKVGHHGSDTSSSAAFIQASSPEIALISCGAPRVGTNSRYKHPRESTLRAFSDWFALRPPRATAPDAFITSYSKPLRKWVQTRRPAGVWLTPVDGSITIETDGESLSVTTTK